MRYLYICLAALSIPSRAFAPPPLPLFPSPSDIPTTAVGGYTASGDLNVTLGFAPAPGVILTLVDNISVGAVTGIFTGLVEGATVTATYGGNTFRFAISYVGGTGNDIILTRIAGPGQLENMVTTLAGSGVAGSADGTSASAQFKFLTGLTVDASGNVYVAADKTIRKVDTYGEVTSLTSIYPSIYGVAVNALGTIFFPGFYNTSSNPLSNPNRVYQFDGVNATTLAGSSQGYADGTGTSAQFNSPIGVAVDGSGNVYVADAGNHRIRKVTATGEVTTLAGSGVAGDLDGNDTSAQFNSPIGVAVDAVGNVYVADFYNNRIRKVTAEGVVTTLAGSSQGYADGTGPSAQFYYPRGVALDASGNVYVADTYNNRIRRVTAEGVVTTLAGSGEAGYSDAAGTSAQFNAPYGVAVDAVGNVYVTDRVNFRIRKIVQGCPPILTLGPATQDGLTLQLTGTVNPNGFATTSRFLYGTNSTNLNLTSNVTLTPTNNGTNALAVTNVISSGLAVGQTYFYRLWASNVDGVAATVVASNTMLNTNANLSNLVTSSGSLSPVFASSTTNYTVNVSNVVSYIRLTPTLADSNATVTVNGTNVVSGTASAWTALAVGTNQFTNLVTAQDGSTTKTYKVAVVRPAMSLNLATASAGLTANGYRAESPLALTLGFAPTPGQVITLVNNTSGDAVTGTFTGLAEGATVTTTYGGNTFRFAISYVGGTGNDITLTRAGGISVFTLAGSGVSGSADGPGATAQFYSPTGVAVDGSGNVYVADYNNNRIRKVTAAGVVTTLAGSSSGYLDATGTSAEFRYPSSVAVDGSGNVYVSDCGSHSIRKVTAAGEVTTLAGSYGYADGPGASAQFKYPFGVAVDALGNVYVADWGNYRIRKVTAAGDVTTLAGGGVASGMDGPGASALFGTITGVALDVSGNVYVADVGLNRIRKVTAAGDVTTLAGSSQGYADGPGASAQFNQPSGVALDAVGNVYVADRYNNRIRKVTAAGEVTTLAGSGVAGYADDTGASAQFASPRGVAVDASGNVYVADYDNHAIRYITEGFRPILTLGAATQSGLTLKLTGTVNPNGFATTSRFLYGTNSTNLNLTSNVTLTPTNNGTNALAVTNVISSGLTLGQTYFYRLWATNVDGMSSTETKSINY